MQKNKRKKIYALLFAALFVLTLLLLVGFICFESNHECCEDTAECRICEEIERSQYLLRDLGVVLLSASSLAAAGRVYDICKSLLPARRREGKNRSLVDLKVKLTA